MSARTGDDLVHATVATRLRDAGQRYTAQRRRLIGILAAAGSPLSIPDILRGGRGLPQSSVYRNLAELVDAGVVRRVLTEEEFGRYELTEDLMGHHHHVICSNCGTTRDVTLPADVERTLDRTLDGVARRAGFADVGHRLDLVGLCDRCGGRRPRQGGTTDGGEDRGLAARRRGDQGGG
jgi:Fur family transcriptional regulator, ferric uptake regulator